MQPGDTLAHYEIRAPLGKGGMGEVFLATDTTLGRDVALKLLPEDFTSDPERVARFRREAQVLASLNHPNISAIYGLEEDGGVLFLIMELAPGKDLAHRLADGPLPLDEALHIASEVAAGLAEAHDKGFVHRDLKPANVTVDGEGVVKILDFGLARAFGGDEGLQESSGNISHSPTITAGMTKPGVVLGTAAYMSPEQARGQTAGKQADIWAFGCLLFEMLTGSKIFDGPTVSDSVAAILKNDPPWDKLPSSTPPPIRRLLRRCLEKDKRRRLRDIGDARLEIEDASSGADLPTDAESPATSQGGRSLLWPVATGILAIALVIVAVVGSDKQTAALAHPEAHITSMTQLTDQPGMQTEPSLSPDGKVLAFVSWADGDQDIFVQRVGGTNPINLTPGNTGLDAAPSFSPDGEKIAFESDREGGGIFIMGATGETPLRVVKGGFDPCWSPDGLSLAYSGEHISDPYSRNGLANLQIVDLASGETSLLNDIDAVEPNWSPSGSRIAFWTHLATVQGQRDIYTMAADGTDPVAVTEDIPTDWSPKWSPDGRWIYFISDRGGSPDLWRVGIDEATGRTTGEPQPVTAGMNRIGEVSFSRSGTLALTSINVSGEIFSLGFDPRAENFVGQPRIILASSHAFTQMTMAPDGSQIAYRTTAPAEHLYLMAGDGSDRRRLVADEHRNRGPKISPDGKWVLFYSNRSGHYVIWAIRTDGTDLRQVTEAPPEFDGMSWLPNGRLLVMAQDPEIYMAEIHLPEGGLEALKAPATVSRFNEATNQFSQTFAPDGIRTAYDAYNEPAGVFVEDVATGEKTAVVVDGRKAHEVEEIAWLDNDRIVLWDEANQRILLWNAATGTGKVLTGMAGPATFAFTDQGRRVVVNRIEKKSDIWLLSLED